MKTKNHRSACPAKRVVKSYLLRFYLRDRNICDTSPLEQGLTFSATQVISVSWAGILGNGLASISAFSMLFDDGDAMSRSLLITMHVVHPSPWATLTSNTTLFFSHYLFLYHKVPIPLSKVATCLISWGYPLGIEADWRRPIIIIKLNKDDRSHIRFWIVDFALYRASNWALGPCGLIANDSELTTHWFREIFTDSALSARHPTLILNVERLNALGACTVEPFGGLPVRSCDWAVIFQVTLSGTVEGRPALGCCAWLEPFKPSAVKKWHNIISQSFLLCKTYIYHKETLLHIPISQRWTHLNLILRARELEVASHLLLVIPWLLRLKPRLSKMALLTPRCLRTYQLSILIVLWFYALMVQVTSKPFCTPLFPFPLSLCCFIQ